MLDATALAFLYFNVIVVSDVVLEWSHLVNDGRVRLRQRCSGLQQLTNSCTRKVCDATAASPAFGRLEALALYNHSLSSGF